MVEFRVRDSSLTDVDAIVVVTALGEGRVAEWSLLRDRDLLWSVVSWLLLTRALLGI